MPVSKSRSRLKRPAHKADWGFEPHARGGWRVENRSGTRRVQIASLLLSAAGATLAGSMALALYAWTGNLGVACGGLATGAGLSALAHQLSQRETARLQDRLGSALAAIAAGDTRTRLSVARMGALAPEAEQLNGLAASIATAIAELAESKEQLAGLPERVSRSLAEVQKGADAQEAAVEETASLQANINSSIRGINEQVENLARSNEETASSIVEMSSAVEQVARSSETLQQTVEASTSSIHQMDENIRRVAESSDNVQQVAEETAASIAEMDRTIQQVGEHTRGASELTELVTQRSDEGSRAVGATIEAIAEIRERTRGAKSALEGLAERIGEIGEIANVIGGISDETNLLSLNAAIIAAQAGEHGKAFAVVAGQVKTLAQRTTTSTKEIDRLIQSVQCESENAVSAMGAGIEGVEEGVARSRFAGESLEEIRRSADEASGRVSEIARAAEEQGRNSRHVAEAARRTSEHVHEISLAMAEQTQASARLMENAQGSVDMCRQVTRATDEQRSSAQYITANIEAITEMIRSIQENTRSHERASAAVAETSLAMVENAHSAVERVPEIAAVIQELRVLCEGMGEQIARFDPDRASRADARSLDQSAARPSSATESPA
jgi:methyl-accepting chemotaxis protein